MIIKIIMLLEGRRKENKKLGIFDTSSVHASFSEVPLGFSPRPGYVRKGSETTSEASCRAVTPYPESALTPFPRAAMG